MRALLRFLLIFVLLYLAVRAEMAIFSPKKKSSNIQGNPASGKKKIDEDRIQDANFRDISNP
jgi:hypothetical protein